MLSTEIQKPNAVSYLIHLVWIFTVSSVPSVLWPFSFALNHSGEESVGPILGRKGPEKSVRTDEAVRARCPSHDSRSRTSRGVTTRKSFTSPSSDSLTTSSFSSGSSEHVEYTNRPPGASAGKAFLSKRTWRACKSARSSGRSRHRISGCRASVPVPEQGASTRMRSNLILEWQRLRSVERPRHSMLSNARTFEPLRSSRAHDAHAGRRRSRDLAALRLDESSSVFPPGAAQRSRTLFPGSTQSRCATACEASS